MSPSTKPPFHGYDAPTRETDRPAQRLPDGWIAREETPSGHKPDRHRSFYFRHGDIKAWVEGFPLNEGRIILGTSNLTPDERDALCALLYWLGSAHALPKETP